MSSIAEGMGFGTGNAFAHRMVDAVFGPRIVKHENDVTSASPPPTSTIDSQVCSVQTQTFHDCLNSNGDDISKCQVYMNMSECKRNSMLNA
ncbi:unnamed protein product [Cuscuta epithymum]|uniref:CHCH domain-containing protein n=1 Tax=Cuscuta epithymum TaxID=186058 RepID=A0AAV0GB03_9ASTE|nr:unnamed protein product [Cuscuta epithymum]CAH9144557.1 unnamed protein product [Cuscuta epithymum]